MEVFGGNYVRQPMTGLISSGIFTASGAPIDFSMPTGPWGTVTHVDISDALITPRAIGDDDVYHQTSITASLD